MMQSVDENKLFELKQQLQRSFSGNAEDIKAVTKYMAENEKKPYHGILLLMLCDRNSDEIGLAAAINLKNYIRKFWSSQPLSEFGPFFVPENEKRQIRQDIVDIMVKSPNMIQRQLCEAIFAISLIDYPSDWPELMPKLVEKLDSNDFSNILGVYETVNEMFKRYRYEFKCNELWDEIKYSLDLFTPAFFEIFKKLMNIIRSPPIVNLNLLIRLLICSVDIFISSISQDLYDHFDENLSFYMENLLLLLAFDDPNVKGNETEESAISSMKTKICDLVILMVNQYDEDFRPYLQPFVEKIWTLLTDSSNCKFDGLICSGINFLSKVAIRQQYAEIFSNPEALKGICENVIIPNMILKDSDLEAYDDNPEEFIRKDIERMDIDTPRRAASDLIQCLCAHLEPQVIAIFGQYVELLLQEYTKSNTVNWKSKDLATYLMISLVKKGQTVKYGVTKTSDLVDIVKFFETTLQAHLLEDDVNNLPILKVDAMKYLAEFRYRLPKTLLLKNLPCLVKILNGSSFVVSSYAAYAIERFLSMTTAEGKLAFTVSDLKEIHGTLLKNLFAALSSAGIENEYAMKAIMRLCLLLQEAVVPSMDFIVPRLCEVFTVVSKAPKKPNFSHYMFETFAVISKILTKIYNTNPNLFNTYEGIVYPLLLQTMEHDVIEFIPYALQLLAGLLEVHKNIVPDQYMVLLHFILSNQQYCEVTANVPGIIRLLCIYVKVGASTIFPKEMQNFLTVFQKLLASKTNDHEGFKLIQYIIYYTPRQYIEPYLKDLFYLMFKRATSSKTIKFVRCFILYVSLLVILCTPDKVIEIVDSLQTELFKMVVQSLYLNDLKNIVYEEKLAVVGTSKILTESVAFLNGKYSDLWEPLCMATFELIQNRSCSEKFLEEKFKEEKLEDANIEFSPGYSQLRYCDVGPIDPVPEVTSSKEYFRTSLIDLDKKAQEKLIAVNPQIAECLKIHIQTS